jgi:hypothetical protein
VAGCQQPAIIAAHIITRAEARSCLTAVLRDGPEPRFVRGLFPSIPRGFEGDDGGLYAGLENVSTQGSRMVYVDDFAGGGGR